MAWRRCVAAGIASCKVPSSRNIQPLDIASGHRALYILGRRKELHFSWLDSRFCSSSTVKPESTNGSPLKQKRLISNRKIRLREENRNRVLVPAKLKAELIGYTVQGQLRVDKPLKIKSLPAFAVVQIGAKQFKVTPGDCLYIEKLKYADINDKLSLNKVLLLGTKTQTVVGRPLVPQTAVSAVVEEHALDAKVIVFKKKRKKNYRRTKGHRQMLTRIRIINIHGLEAYLPFEKSTPEEKKDFLEDNEQEAGCVS